MKVTAARVSDAPCVRALELERYSSVTEEMERYSSVIEKVSTLTGFDADEKVTGSASDASVAAPDRNAVDDKESHATLWKYILIAAVIIAVAIAQLASGYTPLEWVWNGLCAVGRGIAALWEKASAAVSELAAAASESAANAELSSDGNTVGRNLGVVLISVSRVCGVVLTLVGVLRFVTGWLHEDPEERVRGAYTMVSGALALAFDLAMAISVGAI